MNKKYVEEHTAKARIVEELAKNGYVPEIVIPESTSSPKPKDVPLDWLMACANNPHSVEGHLQKWRGVTK